MEEAGLANRTKLETVVPRQMVRLGKSFMVEYIRNNIDTNLSLEELLALAGFASKTQRTDVQMLLLPGDFNGDGRQGISYWLPNQSKIQELVAQHFNHGFFMADIEETMRTTRIAVEDSIDNPEAVQTLVSYLRSLGYENVFVSKSSSPILETTKIIAQKGETS